MKLVSFNVRLYNKDDGDQYLEYRLPFIVNTINEKKPDLIGFQEVLPKCSEQLRKLLPDYYILGHGRSAALDDEQTAIAFRKDSFDLLSFDSFWLSRTPKVPGSRYKDQSICPRTCTCVTLFSLKEHKKIRVYNTHLDHIGSSARIHGLNQIIRRIKKDYMEEAVPYFFMGDFNTIPHSKELDKLYTSGLFVDLTESLSGTFHDFGQLNPPEKIDFIFADPCVMLNSAKLWTDKKGNLFLSDHFPVETDFTLK